MCVCVCTYVQTYIRMYGTYMHTYIHIGGIAQGHKVLSVGARPGKGHAPRCHGDGVCACVRVRV